jgi:regulator of sigma D
MPSQTDILGKTKDHPKSNIDDNGLDDAGRKEIRRGRSTVLSYLLKLNKSIDARHSDLVQAIAQRFNNVLVDYVSYGHFRMLEGRTVERHQLAAIDKTTRQALRFSDRYTTHANIVLSQMKQDLEALAYALEVRFEIEDEVLTAIAP